MKTLSKPTTRTKVAAYCRVSTSTNDQQNSFENQKSYFEREIRKKDTYELHRIYADRGITGTSLNRREQFSEMLRDAGLDATQVNAKKTVYIASNREPLFHKIYVKNTSRFARNVLVIDILRELLKKGVFVYFLDINLLFDGIDKEFMLNLFLNFSQQESIDRSAKIRFGHAESARKGVLATNGTLYGYNYSKETRELTIIEEEAEVVKKVFTWYSEGLGTRRILKRLDDEGHQTRQGKPFVASFIKRMLSNQKYYGTLVRNKYDCGSVFNKKKVIKDEEEWLVFEDRVPAIISKELFDVCLKLRISKVNYKTQKGIFKGTSEFAGKIYCAKCGNTYSRNVDRGRVYFNCSLKKNKGTQACDNKNVSLKTIDGLMNEILENGVMERFTLQKGHVYNLLMDKINDIKDRLNMPSDEALQIKKCELAEVEEEEDRLTRLVIKGQVKEALFDELKKEIDDKKSMLNLEMKKLSSTNNELLLEIDELEYKIKKLEALEVKGNYNREEILDLVSKIIVQEDGSVKYDLGLFMELNVV